MHKQSFRNVVSICIAAIRFIITTVIIHAIAYTGQFGHCCWPEL